MTLLSPLLLLFGLFGLVPLALHLYHRQKRVVVDFSTTMFFTQRIVQSQRRMQLQRILLMLLRVAVCMLLALAVAQPLLQSGDGQRSAGQRDVVILIDDTLSMQAVDRQGDQRSAFDEARRLAADAIGGLAPGDRAAVMTFSTAGADDVALTEDYADLWRKVDKLQPTETDALPFEALRRGAAIFDTPQHRARQVLVISDMQATQWPQTDWPQPPTGVTAAMLPVGGPPSDNVSIRSLTATDAAAGSGSSHTIAVRLRSRRDATTETRLNVTVDGETVADVPIVVPGGRESVEHITVAPRRIDGPGHVTVWIDVLDAVAADNVRHLVLPAEERLPVLLIDGERHGDERRGAFYLATALRAMAEGSGAMQVDVVDAKNVNDVELESYRVVVLAGSVDDAAAVRLANFVDAGGGVLMFAGEADALPEALPAVGDVVATAVNQQAMHLTDMDWEHPILHRFEGPLRGSFAGIRLTRAVSLAPTGGRTIARSSRGFPVLVERSAGKGRLLIFGASPRPDWTNLPMRRNFTTLLSRMLTYLAEGESDTGGHIAGDSVVVAVQQEPPSQYLTPTGKTQPMHVVAKGSRVTVMIPETPMTGFYVVAGDQRDLTFAVNVPTTEADPATVDAEALARFAGKWDVVWLDASAPAEKWLSAATFRRGLWDVLLWVVLAAMVIEPWIANRIGGGQQAGL